MTEFGDIFPEPIDQPADILPAPAPQPDDVLREFGEFFP